MIIHLSKPIASITPRVNPNVNYGFGVTVMCHCRLGSSMETYVPLWCRMLIVWDVDSGKAVLQG